MSSSFTGGAPAGTTTTTATPGNASYLGAGDAGALKTLASGNSLVAPFTPDQLQAQQTIMNTASGAQPAIGAANDFVANAASGANINNPTEQAAMAGANDAITRSYETATDPSTQSQFAAAGRWGSGALANAESQNQQNLATQLGNTDASIENQNYQTGMQQQTAAASLAPSVASASYIPGQMESQVGQQQQTQEQNEALEPYTQLGDYMGIVGQGNTSSSQSTPYYNNQLGPLGALLTGGASIANAIPSSAYSTLFTGLGGLASNIGTGVSNAAGSVGNWLSDMF